ncbi:MAG: DUF4258 domain-containing protein [Deinococcota bacterium]
MPRYDDIIYTYHAQKRMKVRSISKQQIQDVLERPDRKFNNEGKIVVERTLGRRQKLRVVYTEFTYKDSITHEVISVAKIITVVRPK